MPNELLGRIMSVAMLVAAAITPLGALLGGYLVERSGVTAVYVLVGVASLVIRALFAFSPLGHADAYITPTAAPPTGEPVQPVERVTAAREAGT